jgi:hypothetical protein
MTLRLSARKHRVVSGRTNRVDQQFRPRNSRIEFDSCAIGHQVDAGRGHSRCRAERGLHMMLATGAGHAQHGERNCFRGACSHLLFQSGGVAGPGQRGDCCFGGLRLWRSESRRPDADFLHFNAWFSGQRLGDAAHAGPAVHVVDSQCKLRHESLFMFDDSARKKVAPCPIDHAPDGWIRRRLLGNGRNYAMSGLAKE